MVQLNRNHSMLGPWYVRVFSISFRCCWCCWCCLLLLNVHSFGSFSILLIDRLLSLFFIYKPTVPVRFLKIVHSPMKSVWMPSKINWKKPVSWQKKPTKNTMRCKIRAKLLDPLPLACVCDCVCLMQQKKN